MAVLTTIKKFVKLFIPPIIMNGLGAFRRPILEYAPEGWETQLPNGQNQGWSLEIVANHEKAKWDMYCKNLEGHKPLGFSHEHTDLSVIRNPQFHNVHISYAYVLALATHKQDSVSVLDWGGSLGHYYQIGKVVLPDVKIDFHVKEVPVMAKVGKKLNPEVHWHDDERCLEREYDLVMMTGSIPYMKDWKVTLPRIARSAKKYLFLFRFPIVENAPTFVAIQRIYDSQMLHQFLNQEELLEVVRSTGLTLVREFVVGDRPHVKNAPAQSELRGWLFQRNGSESATEALRA